MSEKDDDDDGDDARAIAVVVVVVVVMTMAASHATLAVVVFPSKVEDMAEATRASVDDTLELASDRAASNLMMVSATSGKKGAGDDVSSFADKPAAVAFLAFKFFESCSGFS